jgi:putative hydrolase of the HAD superfamily
MQHLGFPSEDVKIKFETMDHSNVARLGFSRTRFPQSMRDTYEHFCADYSRPFDDATARRAYEIGLSVFQASPRIFPGVRQTLSMLRRRNVRLLLATKGDRQVQRLRVSASGLRRYFHQVHIFDDKGVREYRRLLRQEHIEPSHAWSVGNSIKSDIKPALAVGLNAIWIPRETWIYEAADFEPTALLYTAKSIRDVPRIVLEKR